MKVLLYGPYGEYPKEIENQVKNLGLTIVDRNPEVVITYGGDGTILGSEAAYPGIPKLPLRHSEVCFHCNSLPNEAILALFAKKQLRSVNYLKLEATFGQRRFLALNEFSFRNKLPTAALRFAVRINGKPILSNQNKEELIGDGVIAATPFGSTGYFYSITRKSFATGLGIAFNNVPNLEDKLVTFDANSEIVFEILRGPAHFTRDNSKEILEFQQGEVVTIKKALQSACLLSP